MNVKIKLLDGGKVPQKKTDGAACFDCYANEDVRIAKLETRVVKLGFCIEVPDGYYAEIRGRSGLSSKGFLVATGTIDQDYRGEVGAIFTNLNDFSYEIRHGERICQMQIKPVVDVDLEKTDELSDTERGSSGFGSTGL